jgi:AraC-like DNA-binding protein
MAVAFEKIPFAPGQTFRLLHWSENVREVDICLPSSRTKRLDGAGEAWHFHPEIELTLVTKGRGRRFVGDHVASLEAPDLVLIGSNLPHFWSGLTDSSGWSLQFACDHTQPIWQVAETAPLHMVREIASRGTKISGHAVDSIHDLMQRIAAGDEARGLIHFLEILSTICHLTMQHLTPLSGVQFSLEDRDPHMQVISKAVQYVLTHFRKQVILDDLLDHTQLSKPTFCRQFKRLTGRTLMAFVNQVRVDYAQQLLIESIDPVTDIAHLSGYQNLSHFNRQFKAKCGYSPREFREMRKPWILEDQP